MDIVVCVKRVPDTSEADVTIAKDGRTIEAGDLVFDINEWDKYAVEEAVLLKEKYGGTVTAVTLGPDETEDTLRRCFATGADKAIRLTDQAFVRRIITIKIVDLVKLSIAILLFPHLKTRFIRLTSKLAHVSDTTLV